MAGSLKVFLIPEDTYGASFLKALINRLKAEGLLPPGVNIVKDWKLPGRCRPKLERMVKAAYDDYDRIIVVADAEGRDVRGVRKELEIHIPDFCRPKVRIIILDYCIEEWVCVGLGVRFEENPVRALKDYLRKQRGAKTDYHKYMLPDFVPELDLDRLSSYGSFREFIGALMP